MSHYSYFVAWSPEDGEYVALSSEFPGLSGMAETAEEAMAMLRDAIAVAVEAFAEDGEAAPQPHTISPFSGQLRLRLPRSVHAAAVQRAEQEGVSLNALLQAYVAAGLAGHAFPDSTRGRVPTRSRTAS